MENLLYNAAMPEYLPFNEKHSIQEAQISLLFEGQFSQQAVDSAREVATDALSSDLPNVADVHGGALQINLTNPGSPIPSQTQFLGFQMSAVQRNSQQARILLLTNNQLSVSILDYESWDVTSRAVLEYLDPVLSALPLSENPVTSYGKRVIDRYTFNGRPEDAKADLLLVRQNPYVTPHTFDSGPNWHCNSGWFDFGLKDRVLHNLNVASNRIELSSIVTIDHNATIQLRSRCLSTGELYKPSDGSHGLEGVLDSLHEQNKEILRAMLTPEMLTKIGLVL